MDHRASTAMPSGRAIEIATHATHATHWAVLEKQLDPGRPYHAENFPVQ